MPASEGGGGGEGAGRWGGSCTQTPPAFPLAPPLTTRVYVIPGIYAFADAITAIKSLVRYDQPRCSQYLSQYYVWGAEYTRYCHVQFG